MRPDITPALLSALEPYPPLARLLELWKQQAGCRRLPARRDLDTLALRDWLGHLHLIEVITEGRYRYRVFGGRIGGLFNRDLQNREVGELPEPERSEALLDYGVVVRSRAPLFVERERRVLGKHHVEPRARLIGKLCLPLSDDGTTVSRILAAIYPRPE